MTRKEYLRQRYHNFLDNNLCIRCGKPLDREGSLCKECNNAQNSYNKETRKVLSKLGICPQCRKNKIYGDEKNCVECRAKAAEQVSKLRDKNREHYNEMQRTRAKERYQKDKENGICTRCRKRKADPGYSTCTMCRVKGRGIKKCSNRTDRYKQGLCFFCDNPVKPGYKVCEMHYQKNVKNATSEKANIARHKLKELGPQWKI